MTKYYLVDTDEEVKLGDEFELTFVKEDEHTTVTKHIFKLTEALVPLLVEEGVLKVVEAKDVKSEEEVNKPIDFTDDKSDEENITDFLDALTDTLTTMGVKIMSLNNEVKELKEKVKTLEGDKSKCCCKINIKEDEEDADIIKTFNSCINLKYIRDFFLRAFLDSDVRE